MPRSALLLGATGLVGGEILERLIVDDAFDDVRVLVRRPPGRTCPSKVKVIVADLREWDASSDRLRVDVVFSALGTTIRKAGSQAEFRRVDFEIPHAVATLARAQGASRFLLVSALGADARSRIFYSRVKGELEDAVQRLGYPAVTIARPSVLLGPRQELRLGELMMKRAGVFLPAVWKPVEARRVASALVRSAREDPPGVRILDNVALRREAP